MNIELANGNMLVVSYMWDMISTLGHNALCKYEVLSLFGVVVHKTVLACELLGVIS